MTIWGCWRETYLYVRLAGNLTRHTSPFAALYAINFIMLLTRLLDYFDDVYRRDVF